MARLRSRSIRSLSSSRAEAIHFALCLFEFDRGNVAERGQLLEAAQIVLGDFERLGGR